MTDRRALGARGAVDWEAVRARLETIGGDGRAVGAADDARAVLERRAKVLARPVDSAEPRGARTDGLVFAIAGERYAIEAAALVAVFKLTELALLPGARPPVRGVAAWRGQLLTIVDLRPSLGLEQGALHDLGYVVVVGARAPAFGILADAVHEIVSLPTSRVGPGSLPAATRKGRLSRGVTEDALIVLDTAALLNLGVEP